MFVPSSLVHLLLATCVGVGVGQFQAIWQIAKILPEQFQV
jgi:hypothetical protein